MIKEANKSKIKPESDFHKLLMKTMQRAKTYACIAKILGVTRKLVNNWILKHSLTPKKADKYSLLLEKHLKKPYVSGHNPCKQQRMWQSMRCLNVFKATTIAAIANTTPNHARLYLSGLVKAGYISLAGKESYTHIWKLVLNTGPKAPKISKLRDAAYDPNLKKEVWRKEANTT